MTSFIFFLFLTIPFHLLLYIQKFSLRIFLDDTFPVCSCTPIFLVLHIFHFKFSFCVTNLPKIFLPFPLFFNTYFLQIPFRNISLRVKVKKEELPRMSPPTVATQLFFPFVPNKVDLPAVSPCSIFPAKVMFLTCRSVRRSSHLSFLLAPFLFLPSSYSRFFQVLFSFSFKTPFLLPTVPFTFISTFSSPLFMTSFLTFVPPSFSLSFPASPFLLSSPSPSILAFLPSFPQIKSLHFQPPFSSLFV